MTCSKMAFDCLFWCGKAQESLFFWSRLTWKYVYIKEIAFAYLAPCVSRQTPVGMVLPVFSSFS